MKISSFKVLTFQGDRHEKPRGRSWAVWQSGEEEEEGWAGRGRVDRL